MAGILILAAVPILVLGADDVPRLWSHGPRVKAVPERVELSLEATAVPDPSSRTLRVRNSSAPDSGAVIVWIELRSTGIRPQPAPPPSGWFARVGQPEEEGATWSLAWTPTSPSQGLAPGELLLVAFSLAPDSSEVLSCEVGFTGAIVHFNARQLTGGAAEQEDAPDEARKEESQ